MTNFIVKTCALLLLAGLAFPLSAQHFFGLRAGVNFATASTTESGRITDKYLVGPNAVVYFDLRLNKQMALQPELSYIQRGYRTTIRVLGEKKYTTRFNYGEVAVLMKYRRKRGRSIGYAVVGPYIGMAVSGYQKELSDGETTAVKFNAPGGFYRGDGGLVFGAGLGLHAGVGQVVLDLRYTLGLSAINENYLDDGDIKHRGIVLSAGYAVPLGR
ncbi:MAG: PorT family protein [Bacteroidetes bacterium]|nr:MAG: PorT family protein [Bacteroidota bacterium]